MQLILNNQKRKEKNNKHFNWFIGENELAHPPGWDVPEHVLSAEKFQLPNEMNWS